ncbi:MAG: ABC transporter ATP-binding protein [Bdellovibrionales bacterium]
MNRPLLRAMNLKKIYHRGASQLEILKGIDLDIQAGEAICITGSSGAGKSTLLHILGSLDRPSEGQLYYQDTDVYKKSDDHLATFRNRHMGFVFQFHHLLKEFTALENIMMPAKVAGLAPAQAKQMAMELLEQVGLTQRATHFPSEMSGGEQQRVAVARALVMRPQILLADEPTGNLDTANSKNVQDLFFKLKDQYGLTFVVVSHDKQFASRFPRAIEIKDGVLLPRMRQ